MHQGKKKKKIFSFLFPRPKGRAKAFFFFTQVPNRERGWEKKPLPLLPNFFFLEAR